MNTAFVKNVDSSTWDRDVLQRSHTVPVVVDFWAAWCGPCRVIGPVLERLADEYEGAFELAKLDVDANQRLAAQFGVQGIPTVIAFRNGREADRFTGALPEPQIRDWLKKVVPTPEDEKADAAMAVLASGDLDAAERLFREVLEARPGHEVAEKGLAEVLVERGRYDEALQLLDKLPPDPEVNRLRAAARVGSVDAGSIDELRAKVAHEPDNGDAWLALGRALAAAGEHEEALDALLRAVSLGGDAREDARVAMLDLFELLGPSNPLTAAYRKKLASALF